MQQEQQPRAQDRDRIQAALNALAGFLRAGASEGYQRLDLTARIVSDAAETELFESMADGSTLPVSVDESRLLGLLRELRDAEYDPETGAWFSLRMYVPEGDWWLAENHHLEPAWRVPPADERYREDLHRYPRESGELPPWLSAKVPTT